MSVKNGTARPNSLRWAFTLVELLVVIGIIGILTALLLPAVQSARESSRRTACANNIRQLALAMILHERTHQYFPTGGWGADWVGDPDRGFDSKQPGGWIYNILPDIEEGAIRAMGKGLPDSAKRTAAAQMLQIPIAVLNCPSRRSSILYPYTGTKPLKNVDPPDSVAKGDYAVNGEISFSKSEKKAAILQRIRGLSKTVLVGEKSVAKQSYDNGQGTGDTLTIYVGDCDDIRRTVSGTPVSDEEGGTGFGSAHRSGCNVAMGDGTVRFINMGDNLQP